MKKKTILIIGNIILLLGLYFGCKGILLYQNKANEETNQIYKDYMNLLNNETDSITIKTTPTDDFITVGNMHIQNNFSDFNLVNQSDSQKIYQKENITFSFSVDKSLLTIAKELDNKALNKIIKNNNITNDIELLNYIKNTKQKINIFNSISSIKEYNTIKQFVLIISISANKISYIDGDIKGYMYERDNSKIVYIIKDNAVYGLNFTNLDYFTNDYITTLLETIKID